MPIAMIFRAIDAFFSISLFLLTIIRGGKTGNVVVTRVTPERAGLGEGPHWDHMAQKLYFVDIYNQKLCRLDPVMGEVTSVYIENGPVGVAVPIEDMPDKFVAGAGTSFVVLTWNSDENSTKAATTVLTEVDSEHSGTRFNDGKVDSSGRMWIGTMADEVDGVIAPDRGSLYRIGMNLTAETIVSPVSISNGLAWNSDDDTLYYIDSLTREVMAYDYEPKSGKISNRRVVFDLKTNDIPGMPDGMTIDTDGNLWVAVYAGGRVLNINPSNGELIRSIPIPTDRVTSVAFGGPLLDTLYVTTASRGLSEHELKAQPDAGHVFAIKGLGVHGQLANSFKLPSSK